MMKEKAPQMERIYVAVRARPLSQEESKSVPWQINGNSISLSNQSHKFEFDNIFGESCKTKEVYEARTKDIVASAVSGFNGTVFAYGQTSSGKTHTMKGCDAEPGIIPLAVQDLFQTIQETGDREFLLRMSYMEIYNEEINDLLAPEHRKLQIHENIERGIYVAGLKEEIVNCSEQVLHLMKFGESHRHIGETNMNLYSSRSHTIFRMIIESREKVDENELNDSADAVRVSVLNLVDLAGSERAAKTGAEGKRLKEGSHINKSLLTLGSVIQKLSEGAQSQGGHIPYRDSKLTRILQPALGGNANTTIICNITLAQIHADETKSSLLFASKAKRVTNCVQLNEILTDAALLKRQQKEIEELRAKLMEAEREERKLQQARKIENLSSLVLLFDRDEKAAPFSKSQKKRRETWCPARSATKLAHEDTTGSSRASSNTALIPFEALNEEDESCMDELENSNTDEIPFPENISLLNVTSRRKISSKENFEEIGNWSSAEKLDEQMGTPGRNAVQSLTLREPEAILVIKQLKDQVKLLELEKASIQNNLDNVLDLATQQNNSFTKKYEEMQQEVVKAREEARIAQEKVPLVKSPEETELESVGPTQAEVLEAVEGLVLHGDQLKHSTDGLVKELVHSFSILSMMLQEVKSSANGEISKFKYMLSEFESLTKQLSEKAKELNSEKSVLENQLIHCQGENDKLKSDIDSSEKTMAELKEQYELEKEEMLTQLLMMQNEIAILSSSSSLMRENESQRKELDRAKTKLKDTEAKLKTSIHEKIKLEGEKAQAGREIKQLTSQRALLERDIRKRESKLPDLAKRKEPTGAIDDNFLIREYQNLEMSAAGMEGEIASLEKTLINTIGEKEEALTRLDVVTSELEELSRMMGSTELEVQSLKDEVEKKAQKLKESEFCCESLQKEKEEMEMQLTDALLEAEAQKSAWLSKEKTYIEAIEKIKISDNEIQRLSKDLSEATLELEACREEYKILKETFESISRNSSNAPEEDKRETSNGGSKCDACDDIKKCSDEMISQLEMEKEELMAHITVLEAKIDEDLECQLVAITKERDALMCTNEKISLEINEAEVLRQNADLMVLHVKTERDELATRISAMEAKIHDDELSYKTELTKFRLICSSMQEKLDAYKGRYGDLLKENKRMYEKFKEASDALKNKLRESLHEILGLKKELANRSSVCASSNAQ